MTTPQDFDRAAADKDVLELSPAEISAGPSAANAIPIELVRESQQSLSSEITSLLHVRLRAVTVALLIVYGLVLIWTLLNSGTGSLGSVSVYRNTSVVRFVILGAALAILYSRDTFTQLFLRSVEYFLFGALTLLWVLARYESILEQATARNVTELLLEGRESIVGLFMLMIVHGLFIPHRWQEAARVVLTMALAPALVLVLFEVRHPNLAQQVAEVLSFRHVSMNILIVLVGAVLAIYGSHVLNGLRTEVHHARRFGQYRLVEKLGSGGMGDVFLAEHVLMKRPCALKLIRSEAAHDPTTLARFEREVKTTASLTHPHTIEIYDYGHTEDGTFYYVMEYLPGLSLDELLAESGPLPPERVIYLLRQACGALAEAHSAGLVHRDLKPGNLYVSERGGECDFVKILDFGLVKPIHEADSAQLTAQHVISGTPLYMAPEQAVGNLGLDARCDLYALGAIAYHMLTGHPPFEGESAIAIMLAHAREEVVPATIHRSEIPKDLEQVVLRCLEKSPEDRYSHVLELERALADCTAAGDWNAEKAALWWRDVCCGAEADGRTVVVRDS